MRTAVKGAYQPDAYRQVDPNGGPAEVPVAGCSALPYFRQARRRWVCSGSGFRGLGLGLFSFAGGLADSALRRHAMALCVCSQSPWLIGSMLTSILVCA